MPLDNQKIAMLDAMYEQKVSGGLTPDKIAQLDAMQGVGPHNNMSAAFDAKKSSLGRTIVDQAYQGATLGAGSTIQDAGGYAAANLYAALSPSVDMADVPSWTETREGTAQRLEKQVEDRPLTSVISNVGGALITGAGIGTTKAGTSLANSLRSGNIGARIGKGIAAGGVSGGAYGFNSGSGGFDERLESAGENAKLGAAVGLAAPIAGAVVKGAAKDASNIFKGFKAQDADALKATSQALKDTSSASYQAMRDIGATLDRSAIGSITSNVGREVNSIGKLNSRLHGDTMSVVDELNAVASKGNLGLDELDQYRQLLGQVVRKNTSKIDGANPDAMVATKAISALDDAIENLRPEQLTNKSEQAIEALQNARGQWSKYKKFDRVATILDKSEGDANYIKRELSKLSKDKKATAGFSEEEKAALKAASSLSTGEGILKSLGKFGFDIGSPTSLGNTALPVAATAFGNPALTVAGTAARQGAKLAAKGKVDQLLQTIESGGSVSPKQLQALSKPEQLKVLQALKAAPKQGVVSTIRTEKIN